METVRSSETRNGSVDVLLVEDLRMNVGSSRNGVEREMDGFRSGGGDGDEGGEESEEGKGGGWEEHRC